jgi:hypothetical protein
VGDRRAGVDHVWLDSQSPPGDALVYGLVAYAIYSPIIEMGKTI